MREMADDWDNCCPLCMEEMDSTDRQLKPCRCGYQICVWCWNHIMEMAEKDDTEGRCPACRTVYNREKIVRRSVDINNDRKQKSGKSKLKAAEGRKNLSNVRVIQRNLVYVIGIPTTLADEETLERKEYFGQYGKILKISVSKPTGHNSQHSSASPSVGVYVTYVKEEDALRCIEAVNGYALEGKVLKACFGTTKYCNAWLKYMPCNNPECLYLHDEGTREDSFTKEEMLAKYGSKSQHFHELTHPPQRRSGAVLPPPLETNVITSASHASSVSGIVPKSSPIGIIPKSSSLPAAASWGSRSSSSSSRLTGATSRGLAVSSVKSKAITGISTSMNSSLSSGSGNYATGESMDATNNSGLKSNDTNEVQICATRLLIRGEPLAKQADACGTSDNANIDPEFPKPIPSKVISHSRNPSNADVNVLNEDIQEEAKSNSSIGKDVANAFVNTKDECAGNVLPDTCSSRLTELQMTNSEDTESLDRDIDEVGSLGNMSRLSDTGSNVATEVIADAETSKYSFEMVNSHPESVTQHNTSSNGSDSTIRTPASVGGLTTLLKDQESNDLLNIQDRSDPIGDEVISENPWLDVSSEQSSNYMKGDIALPQRTSVRSEKQDSSQISEKVVNGCREHDLIFDMFATGFDLWTDGNPQDLAQILFSGKTVEPQSEIPLKEGLPWKSSSSKHSRFHFARQDDGVEGNNNFNFQAGFIDRGTEKQFSLLGNSSNVSNTVGDNAATSSMSSSKSLIGAPPGFSAIRAASVPPGFSQHSRPFDSSRFPEATHDPSKYIGMSNSYNQIEASKVASDVEFIDPAIMAVGKGKLQPSIRSPMSFPNGPLPGFVAPISQSSRQVHYDSMYQERPYRNGASTNSVSQLGYSHHDQDSSLQSLFHSSFNNVIDQQQRLPGQSMFQHVIQDSVYGNNINKFRCQPTSWDDWSRFSDISTSSQSINDAVGRLAISQMSLDRVLQNRFEESALSKEIGSKYYADIGIHDDQGSFGSGKMGSYYLQK